MTLDTKLTMALAGCSGSCSANRWHTLSVALPCFRATNPKTLQKESRVSVPAESCPPHRIQTSASCRTAATSNLCFSKISGAESPAGHLQTQVCVLSASQTLQGGCCAQTSQGRNLTGRTEECQSRVWDLNQSRCSNLARTLRFCQLLSSTPESLMGRTLALPQEPPTPCSHHQSRRAHKTPGSWGAGGSPWMPTIPPTGARGWEVKNTPGAPFSSLIPLSYKLRAGEETV